MGINIDIIPFEARRKYAVMHASYNEARMMYMQGTIDTKTWRVYCLFWDWGCFRWSSDKQDRAWKKLGKDAYYRRIERVKKIRERYLASLHPEYAREYASQS